MNGDCASRASRRAISVLPTPVGPIIRMFFGVTSSAMSAGSCWRRIRLRNAMATARFAFAWPMTYLSSSETTKRPVAAPVARALDGGAFEVAAILLELRFERGEQREGIRGGAGESGEDRIVVEPADFLRALLQDGAAEGHLTVTRHNRAVVVPDREDRRRVDHSGQYASKSGHVRRL